ncbi:hypothetical protein A2U01_0012356, partial [Trifolium medium]|nr:hypothetical protein [Trifolium medium]
MENEFLIFPSDVDSEVEVLKAKFDDVVDKLNTLVKKRIDDGRGMKAMELMLELAKRADVKRLTLRNHEEEERTREEEAKRIEEERLRQEEFERMEMDVDTSEHDTTGRGKAHIVDVTPPVSPV